MEDKHLDRILKEKLEHLQTPMPTDAWDLFEQQMDAQDVGTPDANDQFIDQTVFNKLHRLEAEYDASNWKLMAAKLDEEFRYHHQIIRYKAMELIMLFLLVFTAAHYLPFKETTSPTFSPIPSNAPVKVPLDTKENDNTLQANAKIPSSSAELNNTSPTPYKNTSSSTQARKSDTDFSAANKLANNSSSKVVPPSLPTEEENLNTSAIPLLPSLAIVEELELERAAEPTSYIKSKLVETISSTSIYNNPSSLLAALDQKEINPLEYSLRQITVKPRLRKKWHTRIGMLSSLDYNRVITPESPEDRIEGFERYAMGYGGGISFGFTKGRFEVESGFLYTAKQYKAVPVLFIGGNFRDGFYGEGVKDITINMINIPLHFKYNFFIKNRWRFYGLTGVSLQMAYQANYFVTDQQGFQTPSFAPAPAPAGPPPTPVNDFDLDISAGLFEGGSFDENSYLSANFGVGLDFYFTDRLSLVLQPTYQHSFNYFIDGIGPLRDRINTFSILSGIKVRL